MCPANFDRMMGMPVNPSPGPPVTLTSPVTGVSTSRAMYKPLTGAALILRRYTANWAAPDDRKVNPWDLNEPDLTDPRPQFARPILMNTHLNCSASTSHGTTARSKESWNSNFAFARRHASCSKTRPHP